MSGYDVHLVGSIPLRDASEVFETVSAALGPRLPRIPDGETGERTSWLDWLEAVFATHPDFEDFGISGNGAKFDTDGFFLGFGDKTAQIAGRRDPDISLGIPVCMYDDRARHPISRLSDPP